MNLNPLGLTRLNTPFGQLKIFIFIVGISFLSDQQAFSQVKFSDNLKVMTNLQAGFVLPEYSFVSLVSDDYIRSVDLSIYKETSGKNYWEQLYNYPEYGLSLFYSTLGNHEVLGEEIALNYFFKMYFHQKGNFRFFNRIGIGVGYINRKFDLEDNYLNVAVGSEFNIHFNFRLGANYMLTDKFELNSGLSFDHFSNANTSEPNLGINYLTAYAGVSYRIGNKSEKVTFEIEEHNPQNTSTLIFSLGGKRTRSLSSDYYLTSSVSYDFERDVFRALHFGIGADLFYDSSVKVQFEDKPEEYQNYYNFQSGIHISQSLVFNRFTLTIQEGVYLLLKDEIEDNVIYNRGIIQYKLTDKILLRLAMKSHLHILDYPEIGLGIKL